MPTLRDPELVIEDALIDNYRWPYVDTAPIVSELARCAISALERAGYRIEHESEIYYDRH